MQSVQGLDPFKFFITYSVLIGMNHLDLYFCTECHNSTDLIGDLSSSPWSRGTRRRAPPPPAGISCQRTGTHPPETTNIIILSWGLSLVHLWSEKYMFRDHMFRIKCASYLEFCIHSTGWMDILQICIAPILDPLPLWPLQDFTSFTISANLRGTYIAAGSSKSKCQTFFAFLPKQVTFWRQSQTWSWELSLFKISELIAKQYSHSQFLLNHQWVARKNTFQQSSSSKVSHINFSFACHNPHKVILACKHWK